MTAEKKANESQFFFVCGDLKPETFMVMHFQGMDGIDELYEFAINLQTSENDLKASDMINKPASLFIFRDGKYHPYSGIVRKFQFLGEKHGQWLYEATLVPKLSVLSLQFQTRVFQKKTIPDILKEVLDLAGLQNYYKIDLSQKYSPQEYVLQYQESDFQFISRLMESEGIWYFFKEPAVAESQVKSGGTVEKLIITDKPANFAAIEGDPKVIFRTAEGMTERDSDKDKESINEMQFQQEIVPQEVILKNYDSALDLAFSSSRTYPKRSVRPKSPQIVSCHVRSFQAALRTAAVFAPALALRLQSISARTLIPII